MEGVNLMSIFSDERAASITSYTVPCIEEDQVLIIDEQNDPKIVCILEDFELLDVLDFDVFDEYYYAPAPKVLVDDLAAQTIDFCISVEIHTVYEENIGTCIEAEIPSPVIETETNVDVKNSPVLALTIIPENSLYVIKKAARKSGILFVKVAIATITITLLNILF